MIVITAVWPWPHGKHLGKGILIYYCKVGGTTYAVGESLPSSGDSETR